MRLVLFLFLIYSSNCAAGDDYTYDRGCLEFDHPSVAMWGNTAHLLPWDYFGGNLLPFIIHVSNGYFVLRNYLHLLCKYSEARLMCQQP